MFEPAFFPSKVLAAAVGPALALQLAVGVEALPCLVAEAGFCGVCAAVGGFAALDAALLVSSVAGAADELAVCVFLFVGAELAVGVVAVADVFAQGRAGVWGVGAVGGVGA